MSFKDRIITCSNLDITYFSHASWWHLWPYSIRLTNAFLRWKNEKIVRIKVYRRIIIAAVAFECEFLAWWCVEIIITRTVRSRRRFDVMIVFHWTTYLFNDFPCKNALFIKGQLFQLSNKLNMVTSIQKVFTSTYHTSENFECILATLRYSTLHPSNLTLSSIASTLNIHSSIHHTQAAKHK